LPVYKKYRGSYFVSISNSDRANGLNYLATVYNGINLSEFTFSENPGDALVAYGRIHPDKGFHLAIKVAKKTGRRLIMAGYVQDRSYFEKEIAPYVDGDFVKYLGVVTNRERDELLQQAYMVLHLNTIPERFGLVMVEAMAAGVPVVAMDLGSCREVIANGQTGFLVNDVDQAVKAIKKIPEISRRACRQRAEKHFSSDVMVKNYEKVYRRIFQLEKRKMREGI
jgi:glycosyltransferase involved in cell wall biosynthesis